MKASLSHDGHNEHDGCDIDDNEDELDIPGEHGVPAEVLDLVVDPLIWETRPVFKGEILHQGSISAF